MPNDLIINQNTATLPPPMTPAMKSGLDTLSRRLHPEGQGIYLIAEAHAPSRIERAALESRSFAIGRALAARDARCVRAKLAILVGMLPSPMTDVDDAEAAVAVYQAVLAAQPPWAVDKACDAALRGKVGTTNGRFRPTPGELFAAAEALTIEAAREKTMLDKVLHARIEKPRMSAEERRAALDRVRAKVEATIDSNVLPKNEAALLRAGKRIDDLGMAARPRDARDAEGERHAAEAALSAMDYTSKPIEVSDRLKGRIGVQSA